MAVATDDDVIKRRLLIEGDGGSDEKRIINTLKLFIKWAKDDNSEETSAVNERILSLLAQCEGAMAKSSQVYRMNVKEREHYQKLNQDIEEQINDAYAQIAECKEELKQAKRVRKNRQEYDALAKIIQKHPDRHDTMKQLQELDAELETLQTSGKNLDQKLEMRKKQFHVLISAIHEMQSILDEDEKKEARREEETNTESEMDTN